MKIKFIIQLVIFSSIIMALVRNSAELPEVKFKVEKYQGSIGNSPVTMLLTFYPDSSISGYYYYDKVGRLFAINDLKGNRKFKLEAEQIELFKMVQQQRVTEDFEFDQNPYLDNDTLKGEWTYKGKVLPVNLTREKLKSDWRLVKYKSTGYFKNSYFRGQTKDYSVTYPSILNSPNLNMYFLNNVFRFNKEMINFINSTQGKYLLIEENLGDNTNEDDDCCWSDNTTTELVYIADSIVTYCQYGFTYGHNLFSYTRYTSVNPASGEVFTVKNIFKKDFIDSVLTLLTTTYKNVLRQEYDPPSRSDFIENSSIYIAKGGIYFRSYSVKWADYYDMFLSFDEIRDYLNSSFRKTMGLH